MLSLNVCDASVIVVEDNSDNLFILVDILREDIGVRDCNACTSGYQLFTLVESRLTLQIDLVLLDIQIPNEDGYALMQRIRAHPRLRQAAVVAVTANVMPQDVARAREAGFDGFIGKPIDADRFPDQIRRVLGGEAVWESR
jgi:two-component system, cell cycle response regulator DivK